MARLCSFALVISNIHDPTSSTREPWRILTSSLHLKFDIIIHRRSPRFIAEECDWVLLASANCANYSMYRKDILGDNRRRVCGYRLSCSGAGGPYRRTVAQFRQVSRRFSHLSSSLVFIALLAMMPEGNWLCGLKNQGATCYMILVAIL